MSAELVDLPSDVFAVLFTLLSTSDVLRLEQCCRRLRSLSTIYWSRIREICLVKFMKYRGVFDIGNCYRFDVAASGLVRRCGPYLRSLDLSDFGPLEYGLRAGLETAILQHCVRLERLIIKKRLLERNWLVKLADATSQVQHVTLSALHIRGFGALDDDLLRDALLHWQSLRSLDMRNNPRLSLAACNLPSTLVRLDCRGNRGIGERGFASVFARCPSLESLSITYQPMGALPFAQIQALKELNLGAVNTTIALTDAFVDSLGELASLQSLSFRCNLLCDRLVLLLSSHPKLRFLQHLSISGPASPSLSMAVQHAVQHFTTMPHLVELSCTGYRPLAVSALILLSSFRRLQILDISYSLHFDEIPDDVWSVIASGTLRSLVWRADYQPFTNRRSSQLHESSTRERIEMKLRDGCPALTQIIVRPENV